MSRVLFLLAVSIASLTAPAGHAAACQGQEVIFEDRFGDDTGGWSVKDSVEVKDGAFTFKLAPDDMQSNLNVTFTVENADICSDAVWPEGEQPVLGAGLLFWGEDNKTYFQFGMLNNGKFWIARKQDGKWLGTIVDNVDSPAINRRAGRRQHAARQDRAATPCPSTSTAPKCASCAARRRKAAGASVSPATISTRRRTRASSSSTVKVTN